MHRWEPAIEGSGVNMFVNAMEYPFNIIFLLECIIKVVALGFLGKKANKSAYIRDSWNKLGESLSIRVTLQWSQK